MDSFGGITEPTRTPLHSAAGSFLVRARLRQHAQGRAIADEVKLSSASSDLWERVESR
jgi:hypothetical protein